MPYKPRQPRRTRRAKNNRGRKPQKNPKSVKFVDRQLVPYKSSRGLVAPRAYNVEVYQRDLAPQLTNFGDNAATATLPKNTSLHMPCMFNASDSDTSESVNGKWLTPKWLKSKFRISFDRIIPDHADSAKGFNLWMIQGVIKTTGDKSGSDSSSYANWTADILNVVGKNLVDSDFDSDYLEFTRKNRNVKIIKKRLIRPKRNQSVRQAIIASTDGESYTAPPPMCLSVNHELPNFKQYTITNNDETRPIMNNCYIPFVAFMCNELTRDTGTFTIEQSSRFYYNDM